jgi:hypothetical protein
MMLGTVRPTRHRSAARVCAHERQVVRAAVDKRGHFAAWEQPELLSAELRGVQILAVAGNQ